MEHLYGQFELKNTPTWFFQRQELKDSTNGKNLYKKNFVGACFYLKREVLYLIKIANLGYDSGKTPKQVLNLDKKFLYK